MRLTCLEGNRKAYGKGVDDSRKRGNERDHLILHIHSEQSQEVRIGAWRKDELVLRYLSPTMKENQQNNFRIVATRAFTSGIGTITDSSCAYSTNACRFATIGYNFSTIVCEMERR